MTRSEDMKDVRKHWWYRLHSVASMVCNYLFCIPSLVIYFKFRILATTVMAGTLSALPALSFSLIDLMEYGFEFACMRPVRPMTSLLPC
jgi:hypothetical protein